MSEPLVRDLAMEEGLQEDIKDTLEHNNQSDGEWFPQTDKEKITNIYLTIYVSINDMKLLQTVCIAHQPCHSHFCC